MGCCWNPGQFRTTWPGLSFNQESSASCRFSRLKCISLFATVLPLSFWLYCHCYRTTLSNLAALYNPLLPNKDSCDTTISESRWKLQHKKAEPELCQQPVQGSKNTWQFVIALLCGSCYSTGAQQLPHRSLAWFGGDLRVPGGAGSRQTSAYSTPLTRRPERASAPATLT